MLALSLSGCSALPAESGRVETSSFSTSHIQESSESQSDAEHEPASGVQGEELDAASVIEDEAAYTVYELAFERDGMQIYGNLCLLPIIHHAAGKAAISRGKRSPLKPT